MNAITDGVAKGQYFWGVGLLGGLAMGMSAWMQGKAGAGASDALAETGKGFQRCHSQSSTLDQLTE